MGSFPWLQLKENTGPAWIVLIGLHPETNIYPPEQEWIPRFCRLHTTSSPRVPSSISGGKVVVAFASIPSIPRSVAAPPPSLYLRSTLYPSWQEIYHLLIHLQTAQLPREQVWSAAGKIQTYIYVTGWEAQAEGGYIKNRKQQVWTLSGKKSSYTSLPFAVCLVDLFWHHANYPDGAEVLGENRPVYQWDKGQKRCLLYFFLSWKYTLINTTNSS